MRVKLITPPSGDVIPLADMKDQLNVVDAAKDALISSHLAAAISHVDGRAGVLGRAILTQQWELRLSCFPNLYVALPFAPLQSVQSITYVDVTGVTQTVDPSVYLVDELVEPGRVWLADNQAWPTDMAIRPDAVRILYTAGYGVASDVPLPIIQGLKLMVSHWFQHREAVVVGTISGELPLAVRSLWSSYKVWL